MLYIYTSKLTQRLEYTLNFVFNNVLKVKYELTTDRESCEQSQQPFINYSEEACGRSFWIPSVGGLMHEEGHRPIEPSEGVWQGMPSLFVSASGDVQFDLFSAIFYLIARYEEYDTTAIDKHGRYDFNDSIAFRKGFLQRPLVDEWVMKLRDELSLKFPTLVFDAGRYSAVSTIDVDHIYRYRAKSKLQMLLKIAAQLAKRNFAEALRIIRVLLYLEKDPYHQFDYLDKLHQGIACKYILFMHFGPFGRYDRRTIYPLFAFYRYLRRQNHAHIIGLHPSYYASFDKTRIVNEKKRLERRLQHPLSYTRHHFLRVHVPETYRILEEIGFKRDFSLGYAGMYGFRASTCHHFPFYDLENDKVLKIKVHPTIVMDATLNLYLKMKPEQALQIGKELVDKCRAVNGEFVMLWHNNSVTNLYEWEGWQPAFEQLLAYATRPSAVEE
ncbi:MAG: polysaccharide deacetylase family protein [Bacteroidales bacterium]